MDTRKRPRGPLVQFITAMLRSRSFHAAAVFLLGVFTLTWFLLRTDAGQRTLVIGGIKPEETPAIKEEERPPHPQYKPTPTYTPPTIKDPFPALATSTPPPIPSYNVPEKDGWKKYDLEVAPPLLIGFTRTWPMLLQTVVSYITAGELSCPHYRLPRHHGALFPSY